MPSRCATASSRWWRRYGRSEPTVVSMRQASRLLPSPDPDGVPAQVVVASAPVEDHPVSAAPVEIPAEARRFVLALAADVISDPIKDKRYVDLTKSGEVV